MPISTAGVYSATTSLSSTSRTDSRCQHAADCAADPSPAVIAGCKSRLARCGENSARCNASLQKSPLPFSADNDLPPLRFGIPADAVELFANGCSINPMGIAAAQILADDAETED
jgi:hypothetical protein